jgi:hypothetical protein
VTSEWDEDTSEVFDRVFGVHPAPTLTQAHPSTHSHARTRASTHPRTRTHTCIHAPTHTQARVHPQSTHAHTRAHFPHPSRSFISVGNVAAGCVGGPSTSPIHVFVLGTDGFQMKDPDRPLRWSVALWGGPPLERCGAITADGSPYRIRARARARWHTHTRIHRLAHACARACARTQVCTGAGFANVARASFSRSRSIPMSLCPPVPFLGRSPFTTKCSPTSACQATRLFTTTHDSLTSHCHSLTRRRGPAGP